MSISQSIALAVLPGTIAFILVFMLSPIFILYVVISIIVGTKKEKREFIAKHPKSELEGEIAKLQIKLNKLQQERRNCINSGMDTTGYDILIDICKVDIEMKQKDINYYFSNKLRR